MATKQHSEPQPPANAGGRPSALKPEHIAALHEIVAEHAQASLEEIADELNRRCGLRVCTATIRRTLRAQGIVRLKATRRVSPTADKGPKRYGYTAAHRREDVPLYSTDLTDANGTWLLTCSSVLQASGARRHITAGASWSTPVHTCCVQAAPGGYCPRRSRPGRQSTKLLRVGPPQACSSGCKTICESNGDSEKIGAIAPILFAWHLIAP